MNFKQLENQLITLENQNFVFMRSIQYGFDDCSTPRDKSRKINYAQHSLHYVFSGCGYISYDGGPPIKVTRGQIFALIPHHDIVYYPDKRHPWTYAWINFNGTNVNSLLKTLNITAESPVLDLIEYKEIAKLFIDNITECNANRDFADLISSSYLYKIFAFILREKNIVKEKAPIYSHIEIAQKYIEDNYQDPDLNLMSISDKLGLNPAYFSRLFKQQTGIPFSNYLQELRIRKSTFLIHNGETSVKILAESCGFSSQYYFSNIFKKLHLIAPQKYIRQYQERKLQEKNNPEEESNN